MLAACGRACPSPLDRRPSPCRSARVPGRLRRRSLRDHDALAPCVHEGVGRPESMARSFEKPPRIWFRTPAALASRRDRIGTPFPPSLSLASQKGVFDAMRAHPITPGEGATQKPFAFAVLFRPGTLGLVRTGPGPTHLGQAPAPWRASCSTSCPRVSRRPVGRDHRGRRRVSCVYLGFQGGFSPCARQRSRGDAGASASTAAISSASAKHEVRYRERSWSSSFRGVPGVPCRIGGRHAAALCPACLAGERMGLTASDAGSETTSRQWSGRSRRSARPRAHHPVCGESSSAAWRFQERLRARPARRETRA